MTATHYLVTVNLTIRLPLDLIQPEPAGRLEPPTAPEPETHFCRNCHSCGGRGVWCMSAVTMTAETVLRWTMGRNVSASSLFPAPCCAGGLRRRCCRWTRNWKRPCSTGWTRRSALYAVRCSPPAPTGPNTARSAPDAFSIPISC